MPMSAWVERDILRIKEEACRRAAHSGRTWIVFHDDRGAALKEAGGKVLWERSGLGGPEVHGLMLFPDYTSVLDLIVHRFEDFGGARPLHIRDWPIHGEDGEKILRIRPEAYHEVQRLADAVQMHALPWAVTDGEVTVLMVDTRLNLIMPEEQSPH